MELRDLGNALRALSDVARLRMILYLAGCDEITVSEMTRVLRISQPLASWHLRRLRRAQLITTRRVGRQVLCSLNRARLTECLQELADWSDRGMAAPRVVPPSVAGANVSVLQRGAGA